MNLCDILRAFLPGVGGYFQAVGCFCGSRGAATARVAGQWSPPSVSVLGYSAVGGLYRGCAMICPCVAYA